MIFAISVTLFFIVLRFTVTVFNFISNPKLTRVSREYTDFVSILIPVRNEENNILILLESIYKQDYKNYEVIIYDDDSSDDTYNICLGFTAWHPRFNVIKGAGLPAEWTGKNYACHQLAKHAKGEYFLFLDADEIITNSLINSAVYRMKLYKLGLLSLFTNQRMVTFGENTVIPLLHYLLLNLLPLRLIYLTKNATVATASGQFMCFDAEIYKQNQWHKMVRNNAVADAEIMKLVKMASFNGEVLLGNSLVHCRMYKNYGGAINGFSKNLLATFNYSIPGLLIYITLLIAGPIIVITTLNYQLIFFMISLIILSRIMISLSAGQNAWLNILLHPVQMMNLLVIAVVSTQKHLTKTNVWKGRKI
jgi:glycosyltransferase involved in cell wall biosynthesis